MNEHIHGCYGCDSERFPVRAVRIDEGHAAVWFPGDRREMRAYLNGDELHLCFEAYASRDGLGWAVVAAEPHHYCGCPSWDIDDVAEPLATGGVCLERITGDVRIVRAVPA